VGDFSEFALKHRLFLRSYPWRRIDPIPWSTLAKPLSESRLALISSAGFVLPGQEPFDSSVRGGDVSFREIPDDAPVATLVDTHRSETFDHTAMVRDPNLALPIDRMRALAASGRIGSVNRRHLSFMGSLTAVGRLIKRSAPEMARLLVDDGVDAVLLVPV
jgi:D-proline reductase (dithiol) PrdB